MERNRSTGARRETKEESDQSIAEQGKYKEQIIIGLDRQTRSGRPREGKRRNEGSRCVVSRELLSEDQSSNQCLSCSVSRSLFRHTALQESRKVVEKQDNQIIPDTGTLSPHTDG